MLTTNRSYFLRKNYHAVVIGSGPNGLAAAITVAQTGRSVVVIEGQDTIGGGARTAEVTLPGFHHDLCSTVHPLGIASPFFRTLPLTEYGLEWIQPPLPLAHPLDGGTAIVVKRSVSDTAASMGLDRVNYANLMSPLVSDWPQIETLLLGPWNALKHPIAMGKFGLKAMRSASSLARSTFQSSQARALFAGLAAHSILPLEERPSGAFALVLGILAHQVGWPFVRGGSSALTNALSSYFRSLGGEIVAGMPIESVDQLPATEIVLWDLTPRQLLRIAGLTLPEAYRHKLERYRYGPGVCKVDWALAAPIPWQAQDCALAGTVHVGGTLEEVEASERAPWCKEHSDKPFVLLTQPSLFDRSRAPEGKHTAWGYCHVPNGSDVNMAEAIEKQIERFAPGFRSRILMRSVRLTADLERYNPNLVGGDVGGGAVQVDQLLFFSSHNPNL